MTSNKTRDYIGFAAIQMSAVPEKKEANIAKAEALVEEAVAKYHPAIVGLPELFSTEFFPLTKNRKYFRYAEPIPGPTTDRIGKLARRLRVSVIAPIFESFRGKYYDSSPVIGPSGSVVGITRKTEIPLVEWQHGRNWNLNYEKFYFSQGNKNPVITVGRARLGQLICYSRHFPEGWRTLELKGAQIIYAPSASNGPVLGELFPLETRALAFMHQCFAVVVNRVGKERSYKYYGGTHIVDPFGKIIAGPANDKEIIVYAALDLSLVAKARKQVPFMRDRRPDLYLTGK